MLLRDRLEVPLGGCSMTKEISKTLLQMRKTRYSLPEVTLQPKRQRVSSRPLGASEFPLTHPSSGNFAHQLLLITLSSLNYQHADIRILGEL